MTYLDSAILVKLYLDEPDSERWRTSVGHYEDLASSTLSLLEMKCSLRRNAHAGLITTAGTKRIWNEFRAAIDDGIIQTFPIGNDVIEESVRILEELSRKILLRSLDTLHLATARLHGCSALATTDLRMRAGAAALQIPLI
jgi:predicted nucleic acid-binding protein